MRSGLALAGLGLATSIASFLITEHALTATAPAADAVPASVDRTLKGDPLPSAAPSRRAWPAPPQADPKLPDGCRAKFDPRKNIFSAEVAGRCVV